MSDETDNPQHTLVTYGTLAPGKPNHHVLEELVGEWSTGWVYGTLKDEGWGAAHGCPGIVLGAEADKVDVHVFHSKDLPNHWQRLDDFEGEGYERQKVEVHRENGKVTGFIYALADG